MRGRALIALLLASAATPSAAQAATVSQPFAFTQHVGPDQDGNTYSLPTYELRFEAAPGEANDVTFAPDPSRRYGMIVRDAGAAIEAGANCEKVEGGVSCAPP